MPIKEKKYITEIRNIYSSKVKKVAFFIGAGLSMPLFPSWKKLLEDAINLCDENGSLTFEKNELLSNLEKGKYYPEIAEVCKRNMSPVGYRDFLEEQFDKVISKNKISNSYTELFNIQPDLILTSNYDLIPQELGKNKYRFFSNTNSGEALHAINNGKKVIYKLHGDISDQQSLVLTSSDYNTIISKDSVKEFLKNAFSTHTFIFLGFGMNDPHINSILQSITNIFKGIGNSHYALMPNVTDLEAFIIENNYSVKVIAYKPSANDHPEVSLFLQSLKREVNFMSQFVATPYEYKNFSSNGMIKISNKNSDRISDYKSCLEEAKGDIFISGTSMIHLSEDSSTLIEKKCFDSTIRLLILDPNWARDNFFLFSFLTDDNMKKNFHLEIENSLAKLKDIYNSLPSIFKVNLQIRTYKTIFPYIVTGYINDRSSKAVTEITDYIPSKKRPRIVTHKIKSEECLFTHIKEKFDELWEFNTTTIIT